MSDLLSSHVVARRVINNLKLDETRVLLGKMDVSIRPESSALTLSVIDGDAEQARRIAANTGFVFSELVRERFGQPTPVGRGETPIPPLTATVWGPAHIDPARVAEARPQPRDRSCARTAARTLAAFLREHFDRALRTREAVENAFGVAGDRPDPVRAHTTHAPAAALGLEPIRAVSRGVPRPAREPAVPRRAASAATIPITSASPSRARQR